MRAYHCWVIFDSTRQKPVSSLLILSTLEISLIHSSRVSWNCSSLRSDINRRLRHRRRRRRLLNRLRKVNARSLSRRMNQPRQRLQSRRRASEVLQWQCVGVGGDVGWNNNWFSQVRFIRFRLSSASTRFEFGKFIEPRCGDGGGSLLSFSSDEEPWQCDVCRLRSFIGQKSRVQRWKLCRSSKSTWGRRHDTTRRLAFAAFLQQQQQLPLMKAITNDFCLVWVCCL